MKKIKIVIIAIIFYIGLILLSTKVFAATTGITQNDTTRIREKASTTSSTVTLISMNQKVEIESEEGDWYKVKYVADGKTYSGYVRKDMLKVDGKVDSKSEDENVKKEENVEKETTKTEETVQNIEIKEESKIKTNTDLEIRILPLISSNKTGMINKQSDVQITEILGNWCYVVSGEQNGWVMKAKLENNTGVSNEVSNTETDKKETKNQEDKNNVEKETTKSLNKILYVTSETVNLRKEPTTNSESLQQLTKNTAVTQIEKVNNTWSKVQVGDKVGYVSNVYLSEKRPEVTSRGSDTLRNSVKEEETKKEEVKEETKKPEPQKTPQKVVTNQAVEKPQESSGKTGSDIVATAMKYKGYRYVSGGASPKTGFDCSGFTLYVYKQNGYTLNRVSSAQASNGKKVSKSNLQLGDLVFFRGSSGSSIGHVGIYIGGNQFIHAANARKGVIITSLSDSYYAARYVTARRIIN